MRVGLLLNEPKDLRSLRDAIARAADEGFASAWLSHIFGVDALTALAVAGSQVPGIELGTAVVPTYPRHPAALAQQARTVNAALDGRLTLGIGLSHKIVIEDMYGYSFDKPARHMREYLEILLPLARGDKADYTGQTLQGHLSLSTPGAGFPVLIAALAPRMLQLARDKADGTVLWMTGPKTVAEHVAPALGEGKRIVCGLPVCVTDDPEAARARANEVFAVYGQLPSYRAMLDREGAAQPGDVAIVGDEDSVRAQIRQLAEIGVTDFAAAQFAEFDRTRRLLRSLLS
ncbi:TIGR03564 family F420-dependent LLM class oxidoreductase [Thermoactinospora rubra]|uniref:TIGR03564 family F420-dependent LLM class oxidoreductase n=1 Tax=Thermoactinospora rubra TaxID=1088767 RepID=UPI000A10C10A|nr:TIGR03564 family F420-dependent LLM class oxidoreductase [Thermoactinospora rubra]